MPQDTPQGTGGPHVEEGSALHAMVPRGREPARTLSAAPPRGRGAHGLCFKNQRSQAAGGGVSLCLGRRAGWGATPISETPARTPARLS